MGLRSHSLSKGCEPLACLTVSSDSLCIEMPMILAQKGPDWDTKLENNSMYLLSTLGLATYMHQLRRMLTRLCEVSTGMLCR